MIPILIKKTDQKKHHNTDVQIGCCSITTYKYMKVFKTLQQIESSEKFKKKTKNTTKFLQDQLNIFLKINKFIILLFRDIHW